MSECFFISVFTINDDNCPLPTFELKCQNKLTSIVCTPEEIQALTEILNPNKARGPDEISNKMLKPVLKEVSVPLGILFNRSFRLGRVPTLETFTCYPFIKKG